MSFPRRACPSEGTGGNPERGNTLISKAQVVIQEAFGRNRSYIQDNLFFPDNQMPSFHTAQQETVRNKKEIDFVEERQGKLFGSEIPQVRAAANCAPQSIPR